MEDLIEFGANQKHIHLIVKDGDFDSSDWEKLCSPGDIWLTVWQPDMIMSDFVLIFGKDLTDKLSSLENDIKVNIYMCFAIMLEGGVAIRDTFDIKRFNHDIYPKEDQVIYYLDPKETLPVMVTGLEGSDYIKATIIAYLTSISVDTIVQIKYL